VRLAAYVRVSTVEQADHGQGLDIQESAIQKWARSNGHRIVHRFRDEGVSGAIEDREGLESALASIGHDGVEGVVVTSLDRLARSLTLQEAALQQAWSAGGRVFAVDSGEVVADDPDDPMRTFVRQVLGAVSQLEAGMIRRRLKRGPGAQGGYMVDMQMGHRRLAIVASGGELVPDED
jgi:DNA invertase Pin-like site-specific DNA recombinase